MALTKLPKYRPWSWESFGPGMRAWALSPSPSTVQPVLQAGDVLRAQYKVAGDANWYTFSDYAGTSYIDITLPATPDTGTSNFFFAFRETDNPYFSTYCSRFMAASLFRDAAEKPTRSYSSITKQSVYSFAFSRAMEGCPPDVNRIFDIVDFRVVNLTDNARSPIVETAPVASACRAPYFCNVIVTTNLAGVLDTTNKTLTLTGVTYPPTIDGETFTDQYLGAILLVGQTDPVENGLWWVQSANTGDPVVLLSLNSSNNLASYNTNAPYDFYMGAAPLSGNTASYEALNGNNAGAIYSCYSNVTTTGTETSTLRAGWSPLSYWAAGAACAVMAAHPFTPVAGGPSYPCSALGAPDYEEQISMISIYDEGVLKGTVSSINFTGTPVVASVSGTQATVNASSSGTALTLKNNGTVLGEVTSLDIKGTGLVAEIVGFDGSITGSASGMVWKGDWVVGTNYVLNEVVRNATNGNAYICAQAHTSTVDDKPGDTTGGDFYWDAITDINLAAIDVQDKTFLENMRDNVLDWMKTATVGDWVQALAVGAGIVWAGSKIVEMFEYVDPGDAATVYTGTDGYNGAYTPPTLPVVVASLMEFGGYTSGQYDVSLLPTDQVHFTLASTISVRTALQQLALVYQFDIVPSGGTVKFVPKYLPTVRTLTIDDLGHQMSDGVVGSKAPYTAKRMQGIDLPRSVTMKYYSGELDYNPFTQTSTLETYEEGQDVKLDVPLTLVDADAKRISETALVNAHIEQQQYTFTTDYHNIDLEPGDIINIPLDSGGLTTVRIIEINEADEGILEFTTVRAENNTTAYNVSPIPQVLPPTQDTNTVPVIGYSSSLFLEVPVLNSEDKTPRIKVATHGYGAAGWPGATLFKSVDGGSTYTPVGTTKTTPTIGKVVTPSLNTSADYHVWDTTSSVTVQLLQGTLSNSTDIAVQNGTNWCMIGEEVIGFVNATLVSANTYSLTRLLRGRAGSEVKRNAHVANELFVLLDDALFDIPLTNAEIGQTVKYKTVTIGSDLSKVTADDVKPFGVNMRPWAPAHLKAVRQANDDWVITWVERPRLDNQMKDYAEITHDPDWAGYGIAVLDGATVKHTATSVATTYTYTAAQQVIDWGVVQTTLNLSVTQMSTVVGGGYPATLTV